MSRKTSLRFGEVGKARISALLGIFLAVAGISGALFLWAPWARATPVTFIHGIGFNKGCNTPTNIGDPYTCTYGVVNSSLTDTALDTLTFTAISDVVHASPDVPSGNILPSLTIASVVGGASCKDSSNAATTGGAGALGSGTAPIAKCTLPSNSSVTFNPFSFYTVDSDDPNPLTDTATLTWQDTCSSLAPNCPVGDQSTTSGSQSTLQTPTPTNSRRRGIVPKAATVRAAARAPQPVPLSIRL